MKYTKIRIQDALYLYNTRMRMTYSEHKELTQIELGLMLYGGDNNTSVSVSMSRLGNGKVKNIDIAFVLKICEILGVDANFLFGQRSIHDIDFEYFKAA